MVLIVLKLNLTVFHKQPDDIIWTPPDDVDLILRVIEMQEEENRFKKSCCHPHPPCIIWMLS